MGVALIALFVALGGGAYAAAELPANGVAPASITTSDVSPDPTTADRQPATTARQTASAKKTAKKALKAAKKALKKANQAFNKAAVAGPAGPTGPAGPATGAAGGDLSGSYPDPVIAAGSVTAAKLAAPEAWHIVGTPGEPAFANGWGNSGLGVTPLSLRFRKDVAGTVHISGQIAGGTVSPIITSSVVFTLPAGYCPTVGDRYFSTLTTDGANTITPGWTAAWTSTCGFTVGVGNNAFVSIDASFIP